MIFSLIWIPWFIWILAPIFSVCRRVWRLFNKLKQMWEREAANLNTREAETIKYLEFLPEICLKWSIYDQKRCIYSPVR